MRLFLARIVAGLKSVPGIVAGITASIGFLALFSPQLHERFYPPTTRSGTISDVVASDQMTLKDYLAHLDVSHTSNSLRDSAHTKVELERSGERVRFHVKVLGYSQHHCEIEYSVKRPDGKSVIAQTDFVNFQPMVNDQSLTYEVWIPAISTLAGTKEIVEILMFDDMPRLPGQMLDDQPITIAWE